MSVGVTQARVIASEWVKLRSLRSTVWTLLVAVLLLVGLGLIICAATNANWDRNSAAERATFQPITASLAGTFLAQLAVGVLGALVVTGEYSTGMIRSSLAAVPRRLPVLWGKLIVFVVTVLVLTGIASLAAFLGGQALLHSHGTDLSAVHAVRAVIGVPLYLAAIGALAIGLGFLLRSTAAAIAVLFGLLLVVPIVLNFLPSSWQRHIQPYLPGEAGSRLFQLNPDPSPLSAWQGYGVLLLWAAVVIAGAAVVLRRRDA